MVCYRNKCCIFCVLIKSRKAYFMKVLAMFYRYEALPKIQVLHVFRLSCYTFFTAAYYSVTQVKYLSGELWCHCHPLNDTLHHTVPE